MFHCDYLSFTVSNRDARAEPGTSSDSGFVGYQRWNVPADGNCMFAAIAHQLAIGTDEKPASAQLIRTELVDYVKRNPSLTSDIYAAGILSYLNGCITSYPNCRQ